MAPRAATADRRVTAPPRDPFRPPGSVGPVVDAGWLLPFVVFDGPHGRGFALSHLSHAGPDGVLLTVSGLVRRPCGALEGLRRETAWERFEETVASTLREDAAPLPSALGFDKAMRALVGALTGTRDGLKVLAMDVDAAGRVTGHPVTDPFTADRHADAVAAMLLAQSRTLDCLALRLLSDASAHLGYDRDTWAGLDPACGLGAPLARACEALPGHAPSLGEAWGRDPARFAELVEAGRPGDIVVEELVVHRAFPRRLMRVLADAVEFHGDAHPSTWDRAGASNRVGGPGFVVGAVRNLAGLPPNWDPKGRDECMSLMRLAPVLAWARCLAADASDLVPLIDAGHGWQDLEDRLAKAAGTVRAGVPDATDDVPDVAKSLHDQVVMPAVALSSGRDPATPVRAVDTHRWTDAAFALAFSGKSLVRMLAISREWHGARARMLLRLPPVGTGPGSSWEAAIPDMAVDGLRVVVLTDSASLEAEGAGTDGGLDHCVGGYAGRCRSGSVRILSIREEDGRRLSTAEVTWDGTGIEALQHRSRGNGVPTAEAARVLDAYLTHVNRHPSAVGTAMRTPGRSWSETTVSDLCGYDWTAPGAWEAARDAWARFLPRRLRALDPGAFVAALGDARRHEGRRWSRLGFVPGGPQPGVGDAEASASRSAARRATSSLTPAG